MTGLCPGPSRPARRRAGPVGANVSDVAALPCEKGYDIAPVGGDLGTSRSNKKKGRLETPEFESPSSGQPNERELTHGELVRAIRFTVAAESTDNSLAVGVLTDIADEEPVHAGEFLRLPRRAARGATVSPPVGSPSGITSDVTAGTRLRASSWRENSAGVNSAVDVTIPPAILLCRRAGVVSALAAPVRGRPRDRGAGKRTAAGFGGKGQRVTRRPDKTQDIARACHNSFSRQDLRAVYGCVSYGNLHISASHMETR